MDSVYALIGLAFVALLAVAVGVACWERLRERGAARPAAMAPLSPAAAVDVPLEPPPMPAQATSEQSARQAAVGNAMVRMASAPPVPPARAWADTQPIVALDAQQRAGDHRATPTTGR